MMETEYITRKNKVEMWLNNQSRDQRTNQTIRSKL